VALFDAGGRMDFKPTWPQVLQDAMSKCWLAEPAARPHFREMAAELSFDSNPVVYAALAQSAGDEADYSTCDDSTLVATEHATCDDSTTYSTCDDALIGGNPADNDGAGSHSSSEYRESNPVVKYAPQQPPEAVYTEPDPTQSSVYDAAKGSAPLIEPADVVYDMPSADASKAPIYAEYAPGIEPVGALYDMPSEGGSVSAGAGQRELASAVQSWDSPANARDGGALTARAAEGDYSSYTVAGSVLLPPTTDNTGVYSLYTSSTAIVPGAPANDLLPEVVAPLQFVIPSEDGSAVVVMKQSHGEYLLVSGETSDHVC
jgi:hypothetical protein